MLSSDDLKPHLLDPDPHVREAVASYFGESGSSDPDLVPLILRAYDRFGLEANGLSLAMCRDLFLSESALPDVLRWLDQARDPSIRFHLNRLLTRLSVDAFTQHEVDLRKHSGVDQETLDQLEQRRECAVWTEAKLWTELQALAQRSDDKNAGEIDHGLADALVEHLGRTDVPSDQEICELLRSPDVEATWLEIFLIDLAGERRLREAVPLLVERYRVDTDYMLERCTRALTRIGDEQAIRLVQECFLKESWCFKNYTSGLLRELKLPASEEAALTLLEIEQDLEIRTMLCHGLCELFSERGIDVVYRQIQAGYSDWIVHLEEALLPVLHVVGRDLPEVAQWKRERAERDRVQGERRRALDESIREDSTRPRKGILPFPQPDPLALPSDDAPLYRNTAKVGRNEPCPCGSGKKYKRCCAQP